MARGQADHGYRRFGARLRSDLAPSAQGLPEQPPANRGDDEPRGARPLHGRHRALPGGGAMPRTHPLPPLVRHGESKCIRKTGEKHASELCRTCASFTRCIATVYLLPIYGARIAGKLPFFAKSECTMQAAASAVAGRELQNAISLSGGRFGCVVARAYKVLSGRHNRG